MLRSSIFWTIAVLGTQEKSSYGEGLRQILLLLQLAAVQGPNRRVIEESTSIYWTHQCHGSSIETCTCTPNVSPARTVIHTIPLLYRNNRHELREGEATAAAAGLRTLNTSWTHSYSSVISRSLKHGTICLLATGTSFGTHLSQRHCCTFAKVLLILNQLNKQITATKRKQICKISLLSGGAKNHAVYTIGERASQANQSSTVAYPKKSSQKGPLRNTGNMQTTTNSFSNASSAYITKALRATPVP